jgi:ion channel POLLUX/CASTOR
MKSKVSLREKLRYRFDNTLSAGPIAIIGWLAVVSFIIVVVAAAIITALHIPSDTETGAEWSFIEAVWNNFMRAIDAGNLAADNGWGLRAITFVVTIGGIFIVSTLIGTITSGMEAKIEELRKGRSRVLESNHTLILGWSPKIFTILSELIIANESERSAKIVIMADMDKVEMEDEIRSKLPNTKSTKIICRTGSPLDLDDLEVVNPHEAKSIIIISPEQAEHPDIYTIKAVLAITNNPNRKKEQYHIVAELQDEKNHEAAELVGGDETTLVLSADLIARVTAQTCRQAGLSVVYTELLDFDGAEIYFKHDKVLAGKTYREVANSFESSTVIGIYTGEQQVMINPQTNYILKSDDQVIAIAEDDSTLKIDGQPNPPIQTEYVTEGTKPINLPEHTLILGWNGKGKSIVQELDNYVASGSTVTIVTPNQEHEGEIAELPASLNRQKLKFFQQSFTQRATIESLNITQYSHIIVLCNDQTEVQEADAEVLITLLHIRHIGEQTGHDFSIVSEMRDSRNRALAEVAKADDFIVSDKLASLMISQISENKHLSRVFSELFKSEGSEIYIRPVTNYVKAGVPVSFYTVLHTALSRGETAIGHRLARYAHDATKGYGINVNPVKSAVTTYSDDDMIIVLAED